MDDGGFLSPALGGGDAPSLGGGLNQHGAHGGSNEVEVVVVVWGRIATAGALVAVFLQVEVALFDGDVLEGDFELLGDDHRERGLNALTHLRLFGNDGNLAGGRDADESVGREICRG